MSALDARCERVRFHVLRAVFFIVVVWFTVIHHVGIGRVTFVSAVQRVHSSLHSAETFTGIFGVVFSTLVRTIYARRART